MDEAIEETNVWRKCCFCFPLRKGLLFLVYFNVIIEVVLLVADYFGIGVDIPELVEMVAGATGVDYNFSVEMLWRLPTLLNIAFGIILLYAIHKNNVMVLYAYIWYGVAYCVMEVYVGIAIVNRYHNYLELITAVIIDVFYQGYVTLLVRSLRLEIIAKNKGSYSLKQSANESDIESQPLPTAPPANKENTTDNTVL